MGQLRLQDLPRQLRQDLALLNVVAFLGQKLGQAVSIDLGANQNLLTRHQRSGYQHIIHKRYFLRFRHRHGGRLRFLREFAGRCGLLGESGAAPEGRRSTAVPKARPKGTAIVSGFET